MESKFPSNLLSLDYWLISNSLNDLVELTDIIPAIRTDHDAIYLEFGSLENERKGPSYWKMNCSLLDDEEYVNDLTEKIPVWIAEGREQLSDDHCVWDWILKIQYKRSRHISFG